MKVAVGRLLGLFAVSLLAAVASCGGPTFTQSSPGTGGTAGSAGTGGTAGSAGTGGTAGSAGTGGTEVPDAGYDATADASVEGGTTDGSAGTGGTADAGCVVEVCANGLDDDCSGFVDDPEFCQGTGVFVATERGDDATGDGTALSPYGTIGRGMVAAAAMGLSEVNVFVAEGDYAEPIAMVESVNLLGGYQCSAASCTWAREPAQYPSTILNGAVQGVVADGTVTRATVLDGFEIHGVSGPLSDLGSTAAITVRGGASPIISNNRILAGALSGPDSVGSGRAVAILIIASNNTTDGPRVTGNEIVGGTAHGSSRGIQFDVSGNYLTDRAFATIEMNRIRGGEGDDSCGIGGGSSGKGTTVYDNDIQGGTSTGQGSRSWGICVGGSMVIDANRINTLWDPLHPPKCSSEVDWCGGIASISADLTITNNVIFGCDAPNSAGVMLREEDTPARPVLLHSNYLGGAGRSSGVVDFKSAALVLSRRTCTVAGCTIDDKVGIVRNNFLEGGQSPNRFGVFEDPTMMSIAYLHASVFDHNRIWFAGMQDAIYYLYYENGSEVDVATGDALQNLPLVGFENNDAVNCEFDQSIHLSPDSPCIDVGTNVGAPAHDMDQEVRPHNGTCDIGPDEVY